MVAENQEVEDTVLCRVAPSEMKKVDCRIAQAGSCHGGTAFIHGGGISSALSAAVQHPMQRIRAENSLFHASAPSPAIDLAMHKAVRSAA